MNTLQNLHTHTNLCDGKDSPEEMLLEAIDKGFGSIGFSGHSSMFHTITHGAPKGDPREYKREVFRLREKYKDQIEVFYGLEVDMYSGVELSDYDYLIDTVHYLRIGASKGG